MGQYKKQLYKQKKLKAQEEINGATFSMLRHDVFNSKAYFALSPIAAKLLLDAMAIYNRLNNGDLSFAFSVMKDKGWNSETTLRKAIKELLDAEFLILSRQGGRNNRPNLYALSFYNINDCLNKDGFSKIDIKATKKAPDNWKA
ncbi:hypothetical protein [Wohlfahrtiimonas larvae]|uniref:Helix-turn-helix domain-containing protein n=1 Tax=Wohlfahrtiimonas larvae TaxID=1157986 RepID=A0ABP9MTG2_9GAMM|nr:hypothetical protein [Wohlfahrtiimonas larvae]